MKFDNNWKKPDKVTSENPKKKLDTVITCPVVQLPFNSANQEDLHYLFWGVQI
jgi:hypothetical protein